VLQRDELVVWEVDRGQLANRLTAALAVHHDGRPWEWSAGWVVLGRIAGPREQNLAVALALPLDATDIQEAVVGLAAEQRVPFLLLAPTHRYLRRAAEAIVRATGSAFLALNELCVVGPDGRWQLSRPLAVWLAEQTPRNWLARSAEARNYFRHEGAAWAVSFRGATASVADQVGMHYLAALLASPRRTVHAALLIAEYRQRPEVRRGRGAAVLDDAALADYRRRYEELCAQQAEAEQQNNYVVGERVQHDLAMLTRELERATGLHGRRRAVGDEGEKARKSVQMALTRALGAIKGRHPPLAQHLRQTVRMGHYLQYAPEADWDWEVKK